MGLVKKIFMQLLRLFAQDTYTGKELMHTLTICIYQPDGHAIAQACASVFLLSNILFVYPQHERKELMLALSS